MAEVGERERAPPATRGSCSTPRDELGTCRALTTGASRHAIVHGPPRRAHGSDGARCAYWHPVQGVRIASAGPRSTPRITGRDREALTLVLAKDFP
jgi:hypothetical protein